MRMAVFAIMMIVTVLMVVRVAESVVITGQRFDDLTQFLGCDLIAMIDNHAL